MTKILFLDRDGVINENDGSVVRVEDFIFKKGIFQLCKRFISQGYKIVIVTNQTGIGVGKYTIEDYEKVTSYMLEGFSKQGIIIDDIYYCPHNPLDNCECRKPKPKMILDALAKYDANPNDCLLIGDKETDLKAGHAANIKRLIHVKGRFDVKNVDFAYEEINEYDEI